MLYLIDTALWTLSLDSAYHLWVFMGASPWDLLWDNICFLFRKQLTTTTILMGLNKTYSKTDGVYWAHSLSVWLKMSPFCTFLVQIKWKIQNSWQRISTMCILFTLQKTTYIMNTFRTFPTPNPLHNVHFG